MAATIYGDGVWGLADEAGFYAQGFDWDFTVQETMIPDVDGEDVAGALFGAEASYTLTGFVKSGEASPLSTVLGSSLTLANAVDFEDYIPGWTSGGQSILTGVKRGAKVREFVSSDLSGKFKPFLTAVQA